MFVKLDPRAWHAGAMNLVYASHQKGKWGFAARPAANLLASITSVTALVTQILIWGKATVQTRWGTMSKRC
jgi:uncharacterized iron-regulated membrane protein